MLSCSVCWRSAPRGAASAAAADGPLVDGPATCKDPTGDEDSDGIDNGAEGCLSGRDSDGDKVPDWQDFDSDDTVKIESTGEQPNVEEALEATVEAAQVDHRLELLGDHRLPRMHAKPRCRKVQNGWVVLLLWPWMNDVT